MKNCDPKGPLMIYVSKMIYIDNKSRFVAFGRVFSGTIYSNQKVKIMGSRFTHSKKEDYY